MLLNEEIWDNIALYCQPVFFQSGKGIRLILMKCEGSYLFLSWSKAMTHDVPKMPSLFRQKLHPANISNHSTEMVAFLLTAWHRAGSRSLFREGLIPALGAPLSMVRNPCSVWDLLWCPQQRTSSVLLPALHAPSPLNFSTALTQFCLIFGNVWEYISC